MQTAAALPGPLPTHHRTHSHSHPGPIPSVRRKPAATSVWEDMGHTQAWVLNQGFNSSSTSLNVKPSKPSHYRKHGWMTEEWVGQQAVYYVPREDDAAVTLSSRHHHSGHHRSGSLRRDPAPATTPRRAAHWEDMMYQYEVDAERWMRHEAESRRAAEERLRMRTRVEEELRRIDERSRQRKHEQRRMFEENRARMMAEAREHERRDRPMLEKKVAESWEKYESRWSGLASSSEPLTFANIPWPTVIAPRTAEDLSMSAIASFLLSGAHSQETTKKERIRSAQLRWHPDRFRRLMARVSEEEKAAVEESVGAVARVLNDLMQREKGNSK
ncbi:hypothetical protein DFP72DRAFT_101267 [Ephemerocybe angulata]|uniref:Uncharacterized protein n=1 Tax=Ephemerocybe angulata TaxID=980116 RepID=A0A8H6M8X9_9AGAR|nr:hypothetical protein DFP72DRAFT_101267 [Tulosesus angulatus]